LRSSENEEMKKSENINDGMKDIRHFRHLSACRRAFQAAMDVYEIIILMLNSMERNAEKFCF
jgi:hypothetical protein